MEMDRRMKRADEWMNRRMIDGQDVLQAAAQQVQAGLELTGCCGRSGGAHLSLRISSFRYSFSPSESTSSRT